MIAAPGALLLSAEKALDRAAATLRRGRSHVGRLVPKHDQDFASTVDLEIERLVREILAAATPDIPLLGEEGDQAPLDGDAVWVLDPIDGTLNFIAGSPFCSISLALVTAGRPVLAIVDAPLLNERYVAVEGAGAYLNGLRVVVSDPPGDEPVVSMADFGLGELSSGRNALQLSIIEHLVATGARVRIHGSAALDLAWMASGRLSGTLMASNLPWDVLGGVLLVREAGGLVFDADGSPHSTASAWTIAATPTTRPMMLDAIVAARGPVGSGGHAR